MVDVRPLLFLNALAAMLLVTAGFASMQGQDLPTVPTRSAVTITGDHQIATPTRMPADTFPSTTASNIPAATPPASAPAAVEARSPVFADELPAPALAPEPQLARLAAAERDNVSDIPEPESAPAAEPPPPPTTGQLTLRSNVVGDTVTINGKTYGATRLDVELDPGQYDVTISKDGFKPWSRAVTVRAGNDLTLMARLEAYTRVNYRNGQWLGGVKTGDGQYQDSNGLRYEGHFVNGLFHGDGKAWYSDGSRYEGEWHEGARQGEGTLRGPDGSRYTGQFHAGEFHGQGTLTRANGDILTGLWDAGLLNGHGSLSTTAGLLYVGGFRNSRFHGEGTLTEPDGRHYEGASPMVISMAREPKSSPVASSTAAITLRANTTDRGCC